MLPDHQKYLQTNRRSSSQCTWRCEVLPDPYLWKPRHTATSRGQIATDPASTPRDRLTPPQNYHLSLKTSQAPPTPPKTPPATNFQRSHAEKSGSKRTKLCTVDQIATSPPHHTSHTRPTSTARHSPGHHPPAPNQHHRPPTPPASATSNTHQPRRDLYYATSPLSTPLRTLLNGPEPFNKHLNGVVEP